MSEVAYRPLRCGGSLKAEVERRADGAIVMRSAEPLAPYPARAVVVACHPTQEVVAVGYADGLALLVRVEDGAEILVRKSSTSPVSALAWRADGRAVAFGTEDGDAGVVDLG